MAAPPDRAPPLTGSKPAAGPTAAPTPASTGNSFRPTQNYADEMTDFGIAPQQALRLTAFHAPTPTAVPGASTISTEELQARIKAGERMVLLDVLDQITETIPGAHWLQGAGFGNGFRDAVQQRLRRKIDTLTGGNRNVMIVTFCLSSHCWLSYNTALRLAALGYRDVRWYRGGHEAWQAAGLRFGPIADANW
jgi:PQQ-dependent catabolism-associated CXXCW motif protein